MRDRVELLLGRSVRGMWVMTFHSACARMLRADAQRLGYTRSFTIYDQADSRRLVRQCIGDLDVDPKRFTPAAVQSQISDAKNKLRSAEDYRQLVGSYFEQTVADVYDLYEREIHRANAMDFDDLLFRTVNVLELFPEVRERYQTAFRHVLVDEYQDTNHAQYRLLQLLTGVGTGTTRTRGTEHRGRRRRRPVSGRGHAGDHGGRDRWPDRGDHGGRRGSRPATEAVTSAGYASPPCTHGSSERFGVAITTTSGRRIVSTPSTPTSPASGMGCLLRQHLVYLMWRRDKGFRVGTTRLYTDAVKRPISGVQLRSNQEHADAALGASRASPPSRRLAAEECASRFSYQLPTLPFPGSTWRRGRDGLVADQGLIDRLFARSDTRSDGFDLLRDHDLLHFRASRTTVPRRTKDGAEMSP